MQNFKKILSLFTIKERKSAFVLLFLTILMAIIDMMGVASIFPFITVLNNPALIDTNFILSRMFQVSFVFGIETAQHFLFFLGFLVFVFLITSLIFRGFVIYLQIRFVLKSEFNISKRLVEKFLNQPYSWFLSRNSANIGTTILSEVNEVINVGVFPMIELISKTLISIFLIILLVLVDPKIAFVISVTFLAAYLSIFYLFKNFLRKIGEVRLKQNNIRFRAISDAFGAIKEIKVGGLEQVYNKNFSNSAEIFARVQTYVKQINQMPRLILEGLAFGSILLTILYMMHKTGSLGDSLPVVSLYAFAGYRLLPAIQQIYNSVINLTYAGPLINKLYEEFKNLELQNKNEDTRIFPFKKTIDLKNIYFNYPNSSKTALKNINLSIKAKSIVGLIGVTGSGKTTLADIILGLLEPQKGILKVDGKVITKQNLRSWQLSVGYVPQHIYLFDDTLAANIALGVNTKDIDQDLLEKVSRISNLYEFIENELPQKYQTRIGERGVRLSGGQRQRIGIARALYRNPKVLILDEATSALDNETEKLVMDAISNISRDVTIILIAHRLGTVKVCDIIYQFKKGEIINQLSNKDFFNKQLKI